jgi:hypothetical protein
MIGRRREVRFQIREVGVDESVALQLAYHISVARLGRRRLAARTGLSEMAVRIELERMRDRDFVRLLRSGVELTAAGRRHFRGLLDPIVRAAPVELSPSLRLDDVGLAAHLTSGAPDSVWAVRDAAVREGATGLLLLRYGPGGWAFAHDGEPVGLRNPGDAEAIGAAFPDPSEGDLLPIAFGPNAKDAGLGLWRAVLALLAHVR